MGMRLANGQWSDALADTPENQAKYGEGSGYAGGAVGYSGTPSTPSTPSTPGQTVNASANALGQQLNSLLGAIASGNRQAFDEAVRQFNATFGLDQQKFTEAIRQYNEGLAVTAAGLTGQYQGQQTLQSQLQQANIAAQRAGLTGYYVNPSAPAPVAAAAGAGGPYSAEVVGGTATPQQQAARQAYLTGGGGVPGQQGVPTLAREQQTYAQQMGMINAAAQLQANPFRQQQALGQMSRLLSGQGVAGFQAPTTVQGVGTAGGNTQGGLGYLQQMIDDIRNPAANTASVNQVMQAIPTPNKINSTEFLRAAPSTQNMVLQGMQEKYGLDPQDALTQIKNTLPQFRSPTTFGQVGR